MPVAWQADRRDSGGAFRIVFLGDLMATARDRPLTLDPHLRARVERADLAVINVESPVAERTSIGVLVFVMSQRQFEQRLEALGLDPARCVVTVANNHVQDLGLSGCKEFTGRLGRLGVSVVGLRADADEALQIVHRGELRIGFATWTEWMNRGDKSDCAVWHRDAAARVVAAAANAPAANVLVGYPHWDYEFCHFPSPETVERAHRLLEGGFALLVGHHPHVLQPIERCGTGICAYSLGNVTPMPRGLIHWATRLGGIMEVEVALDGPLRGAVTSYHLHPFFQWRTRRTIELRRIDDLPPRLRRRVIHRLHCVFPSSGER
jgi:poly-gamma-glutamate synthesis protein (capsule biosynthesis protein)